MWRFCHTDMSLGLLVHGVSLVAYLVATGGTTSRARVHMIIACLIELLESAWRACDCLSPTIPTSVFISKMKTWPRRW